MKQEDKQYEKWLTGKETEKVSHRSMGIRHCRLIITPAIHQ